MWYVPYERLLLVTSLSVEEALQRLADSVEPRRFWRWGWEKHKPYQGTIEGERFEISRIVFRRNTFLPLIRGEVRPDGDGAAIDVRLAPPTVALAFLVCWVGILGLAFLALLVAFVRASVQGAIGQYILRGGLVTVACALALSYGVMLLSFRFEASRSKAFLRELFQASPVESGERGISPPG